MLRKTLAAAAIVAAFGAHAQEKADKLEKQDPAAKPAEDKSMQKVEVKANADGYDPRRDDTASKIVVGHEEIIKYGDQSVLDVFKRLPGLTVVGSSVRMRGLGSYTQVLVNGERAPAGFSLDALPPDAIEKIEIVRAATAEYSTQSIAGTINIILKKSVSKSLREFKGGVGGSPVYFSPGGNLALSDKLGNFSYSINANLSGSVSQSLGLDFEQAEDALGRTTVDRRSNTLSHSFYEGLHLNARLNWALENGDSLSSQNFMMANRGHGDYAAQVQTLAGQPQPFSRLANSSGNSGRFARSDLNWVHNLGAGAKIDAKIGVGYGQFKNNRERLAYELPRMVSQDQHGTGDSSTNSFSTQGKYTTPLFTGHALATGWDLGYSTQQDDSTQRDLAAPSAVYNYDNTQTTDSARVAFYAQDEWNITPAWSLYLGARWEGIRLSARGNGISATVNRSSVFSPLMQTLYKIPGTKGDQLRLALTKTYRPPNSGSMVARRNYAAVNTQTTPDYMGNPKLRPELANGIDAGWEHYWAEGALFSVSLTQRRISDFVRNGVVLGADGRWVSLPVNLSSAKSQSMEVELKFPLKVLIDGAPAVDLRANVSRNWSRVQAVPGPDNRLDRQNPLSANLGFDYKDGALTAGASFNFRAGGLIRTGVAEYSYEQYARDLEMYGLWKFDPRTSLRLGVRNMLKLDSRSETIYRDANGTSRELIISPTWFGWRLLLEMKF